MSSMIKYVIIPELPKVRVRTGPSGLPRWIGSPLHGWTSNRVRASRKAGRAAAGLAAICWVRLLVGLDGVQRV